MKLIGRWLQDPQANIVHYVLIRAMDRFYESHNRYPGIYICILYNPHYIRLYVISLSLLFNNFIDAATYFLEDDAEEVNEEAKNELNTLKTYVNNLLGEWEITNYPEHLDNHIHEM